MKKAIKLILAIALALPAYTTYASTQEPIVIQAKVSGDYTYEALDDDSVVITNYNGGEKQVSIPSEIDGKKVTKIGYGAFAECKGIERLVIADTVTVIDAYAFSQCQQITSVELPDSVVSLGRYAFAGNNSLKSIKIPNKIRSLGYGVFFDCISLQDVKLPEGLQNIGGSAFGNCRSLISIAFPSTMVSIESNAFSDCVSLETVVVPYGVTSIGSSVFSGCLSLDDIQLPDTLVSIGQSCFKDCIALESIHLPDSVLGVGYGAFSGCTALQDINIPNKVTTIANATFSGCSSLETLIIPDTVEELGDNVFSGCTMLKNIVIPDSVKEIGESTFTYCNSLTTLQLPSRLKAISTSLFRYCDSLESIVIPNSVTSIGSTAFADCPELKSVTVPASVSTVSIGSRVFSNSPNLVVSVVSNSGMWKYVVNNNVPYRFFVSGLNLDKDSLIMSVGDASKFNVIMSPYNIIENSRVIWSSDDPDVASVDAQGIVTANSAGKATIRVSNDNGMYAEAVITVSDVVTPIEQISISYDALTMKKETSVGLKAVITPKDTTMSKLVLWESDDTEIVTVSSTGTLFARKPGTTIVRAISSNGLTAECKVTVISEIKSVSLNQTAMALDIDVKQQLRATINPTDTTDSKDLVWKSSNTKVATVDQNGQVTTIAPGTATITVTTVNNKKAECKITVVKQVENIPITSVDLNENDVHLKIGKTTRLTAQINPANTTDDKSLTWESDHPQIASVKNGTVTALSEGTAVITVTTSNGKKDQCIITVERDVIEIEKVELNKEKLTLEEGQIEILHAVITPTDTTQDPTLSWKSSNPEVVSVENGKVTALKAGTAVISVVTSNNKTASCTVTVTKKVIAIEKVELNKQTLTLEEGQNETLTAMILPTNTTQDTALSWESSNEEVASVVNGKVTALKAGTAEIKVITSNGKTALCTLVVQKKQIPIENVIIEPSAVTLRAGAVHKLNVVILPSTTTDDKTITWSSSNPAVVSVDQSGKITAIADGKAVISAQAVNGVKASCEVTVFSSDKALLLQQINAANALDEAAYTSSSYGAMQNVLIAAQEVYEDEEASQIEIDAMETALQQALDDLIKRASVVQLKELTELISACQTMEKDFTASEFSVMQGLIDKAEAMLKTDLADLAGQNVTLMVDQLQHEKEQLKLLQARNQLKELMDAANDILAGDVTGIDGQVIAELRAALSDAQVLIDTNSEDLAAISAATDRIKEKIAACEVRVEYTYLATLVALCESYDSTKYTMESWRDLETALQEAKSLIDHHNATQKEIDQCYESLSNALIKLKIKVNKAALNINIDKVREILDHAEAYVPSTMIGLESLLEQAEIIAKDDDTTQEQVKAITTKLIKAIMKVRFKAN